MHYIAVQLFSKKQSTICLSIEEKKNEIPVLYIKNSQNIILANICNGWNNLFLFILIVNLYLFFLTNIYELFTVLKKLHICLICICLARKDSEQFIWKFKETYRIIPFLTSGKIECIYTDVLISFHLFIKKKSFWNFYILLLLQQIIFYFSKGKNDNLKKREFAFNIKKSQQFRESHIKQLNIIIVENSNVH